jgi:hypothetical protein
MTTDSLHTPPGPTYMPQTQANALDAAATAKFDEGTHSGEVSDIYILITMFLAAVLFLIGIGSTFKLHQVRCARRGMFWPDPVLSGTVAVGDGIPPYGARRAASFPAPSP